MSDRFHPLGAERLAAWIAREINEAGSVFGIPRDLWFSPTAGDRFAFNHRGARVQAPIGVAAGPHTQLAQNIVIAWLCGARVIELKTVQTLDRIEVSKPCIEMRDEGYNIEWSQELTVRESFSEYLTAWVLVHALHAELGFEGAGPGALFDLSVGYDLAGIRQPKMRWFIEHMLDPGDELERCVVAVARSFPGVLDLDIPPRIADSVTLSTLHGCPPEEIGAIAEHLFESWGLHTAVKLNPTLLGFDTVRKILVEDLCWSRVEPHRPAFDADIGYPDAIELIGRLEAFGARRGLDFGVKLCNTLPVVNRCPEFHGGESVAYLSGRPLHALAVELARRLTDDTDGRIDISFAGGADAFNTPALLAAGLRPVTVCSDLLRPGGYLRLRQYLEEINTVLDRTGAGDLDELIIARAAGACSVSEAARHNLEIYADSLRNDPGLLPAGDRRRNTKTDRSLGFFDCIEAPCADACSVRQQVPAYMRRVAVGDVDGAAAIIAEDNPLPSILGRACHHPCEPVCLRTHLDRAVAIREIKRFAMDNAGPPVQSVPIGSSSLRVAIVGAGPCGLAAAATLARAGVRSVLFESRDEAGGMVSATIPGYRASSTAVRRDLDAITALGVEVEFGVSVGRDRTLEDLLSDGYSYVIVAVGAQRGLRLAIDGEDAAGVMDGLDFLRQARHGTPAGIGRKIAVIGGGDVAMDCARTARRLSVGEVAILYRRSIDEMPAHREEIRDLLAEGITIRELVAARRIITEGERIRALECATMSLGAPDASGRPRPVEGPAGNILFEIDTLIVAIGQQADLGVFTGCAITTSPSGYLEVDAETLETSLDRVYAGGDLRDPGPKSIVDACGDGQRIARAILAREGRLPPGDRRASPGRPNRADLLARRARRLARVEIPRKPEADRRGFDEVIETLGSEAAAREAARCLDCDQLCSTCEGVCPNRAIATYFLAPPPSAPPGEMSHGPDGGCSPEQLPQVAVLADLCNECGNCATFCPTTGKPWRDKPRVYFDRRAFAAENDNAFMLLSIDGRPAIQAKFHGRTHQLVLGDDPASQRTGATRETAIMAALLGGLAGSMPYLPMPEAEAGWLVTSI